MSRRIRYRDVFFAHHGPPPYVCHFCKSEIEGWELHIHHVDGVHENNEATNLVAAHPGCHERYHHTGRKWTPEQRAKRTETFRKKKWAFTAERNAKVAAAKKQQWQDPEYRSKMIAAGTIGSGKTHSEEVRAKIGKASRERGRSPEAIAKQRVTMAAYWASPEGLARRKPVRWDDCSQPGVWQCSAATGTLGRME